MGVADGACADPALPVRLAVAAFAPFGEQGGVPRLDVARGELLQELAADMRDDMALDQSGVILDASR